jgi:DNA adenine methylase
MQQVEALPRGVFYYLDPPFFEKADRLYRYFFRAKEHVALRDSVVRMRDPWLLSYDSVKHVADLYSDADFGPTHVEVLYSTSNNAGSRAGREVIITNLPCLPVETRLWRRNSEWRSDRKTNASNRIE